MEHTPGPWETKRLHCVTAIETESASRITCLFDHQDYAGEPCGSIESQDKTQAEIDANARLIAAAPELFEAIKVLVTVATPNTDPVVMFVAIERAREAIQKAT